MKKCDRGHENGLENAARGRRLRAAFLNLTSERASNLKKHVFKNRFISNYFMKAASSSPVKCSKIVFTM